MTLYGWPGWLFAITPTLALIACTPPGRAGMPDSSTSRLRVERNEPPPGARMIGPIEGSDGPDCALLEARGTEEGALAALRKAAAERGIDFVKVIAITEPHSDHVCLHKQYRIEGMGYALTARQPAPACTPACAPGYSCRAGSCEAQCDPTCNPGQYCRFDRVCAPLPAVPAAPPPPSP